MENNCIVVPTIKPATTNHGQCKKRPVDYIKIFIYPIKERLYTPFVLTLISFLYGNYFVWSYRTKSESDAVTVAGIVVIDVTIVVDIAEVVAIIVVWRTQPPVARCDKY